MKKGIARCACTFLPTVLLKGLFMMSTWKNDWAGISGLPSAMATSRLRERGDESAYSTNSRVRTNHCGTEHV
jgi:hypothetical protein